MESAIMIAAVAAGGAIGAGLFVIAGPFATLLLNIAGSAFMGCLASAIAAGMVLLEAWRGFFVVGLLGALTTFSSFAHDAGQLWQKQGMVMDGAYVMASVLLALLAFGAAFWAVRRSGIC